MARPGAGLELQHRRRIRAQAPGALVEDKLEYLVGTEMRHENEAIRPIAVNRVGVARGRDHLQRLADAPVRTDRIDAHQVRAVRSAEKPSPGAVERDIGKALGERSGAHELQRAARAMDAVSVDEIRLAAHCRQQPPVVAADRHRHDELVGLEARPGLQRAVGLQPVHANVAFFGGGHVDVGHGDRARAKERERHAGDEPRPPSFSHLRFPPPSSASERYPSPERCRQRW